jgi:hypothetical protein
VLVGRRRRITFSLKWDWVMKQVLGGETLLFISFA